MFPSDTNIKEKTPKGPLLTEEEIKKQKELLEESAAELAFESKS